MNSLKISFSVASFSADGFNGVGGNCNTLLLTMRRNLGGNQVGASYKWLETLYKWLETLYNVQVVGDIVHCTSGLRHAHIVGKA